MESMLSIVREVEPKIRVRRGKRFVERRVLVRCTCGRQKETLKYWVDKKVILSCGCLRKKQLSEFPIGRRPEGHSYLRHVYRYYKVNARRRPVKFQLTLAQFHQLIIQPCHYCGAPPVDGRNCSTKKLKRVFHGTIKHHGLDRVDNASGYVEGNVVPCCRQCNYAKGNMGKTEFLSWVSQVHHHQIVGRT